MQRPPALGHLSSDHQIGLVRVRKARQAADGSGHDQQYAWTILVACLRAELELRFQLEDKEVFEGAQLVTWLSLTLFAIPVVGMLDCYTRGIWKAPLLWSL